MKSKVYEVLVTSGKVILHTKDGKAYKGARKRLTASQVTVMGVGGIHTIPLKDITFIGDGDKILFM